MVNVWIEALQKARKELGLDGRDFPHKGSELHERATQIKNKLKARGSRTRRRSRNPSRQSRRRKGKKYP